MMTADEKKARLTESCPKQEAEDNGLCGATNCCEEEDATCE